MADSKLHPAFEPPPCSCAEEEGASENLMLNYLLKQEQAAEYAIEQELAQLRADEAGRMQMDRFVRLLQAVRDEQIAMRQQLERLIAVIAA